MRKANIVNTIAILSVLSSSIPVYADATGQISLTANINSAYDVEIYIILTNSNNQQKLIILKSDNNYTGSINLEYGNYDIKEIHVYSGKEIDEDRREMNVDYTIENDNLNLNENNKIATVNLDIKEITEKESESKKESEKIENQTESENNITTAKDDSNKDDTQEKEKANKSLNRRKNFIFFNFIIDAILIISLGAVWFFKIRERKEK